MKPMALEVQTKFTKIDPLKKVEVRKIMASSYASSSEEQH